MSTRYATCYADIEPEETVEIWPGKLHLKEAVLGAGEGGIGKGLWVADVAARVSLGDSMPDGSDGLDGPRNVVLITPEDHIRRAMAWRLRAAGADLSRVFDLTTVLGHDFTIPDDLGLLKAEIERIGDVALVIIDPLSQVVDRNLSTVKFVRRQVWGPLKALAEGKPGEPGCCVVAMHHLTKAGVVAGSAALVQSARLLLRFAKHEMDEELVVLQVEKTNIGPKGSPVQYRLVGEGHEIHVEYEEPDIMPDMGKAGENAKQLVWQLKRANGPVDYKTLAAKAGMSAGNARVTLHRLAKEGVVTKVARGTYEAA